MCGGVETTADALLASTTMGDEKLTVEELSVALYIQYIRTAEVDDAKLRLFQARSKILRLRAKLLKASVAHAASDGVKE